jgi:hypothetical protein
MLFTRLYNWIKYKTLPPSVLSLNRLFVERDSKHRRVTSNLGLTFRNSKWSTYARTNVNLSSRASYSYSLAKVFCAIVILSALYSFSSFYNTALVISPMYTFLWFICDSDLYLKVAFSSSLLCSIQVAASSLFNQIFFGRLTVPDSEPAPVGRRLVVPRRLHKPIFYTWLSNQSGSLDFEKLFEASVTGDKIDHELSLLQYLFKSAYFLARSSDSALAFSDALNVVSGPWSRSASTPTAFGLGYRCQSPRLNSLLLDYTLFSPLQPHANSFFSECKHWVLEDVQTELASNSANVATAAGTFYNPTFSYSSLNSLILNFNELSGLRYSAESQLAVIQWQRWLYKYNLLHRSVLKASSFMTLTKRLVNSGFYSSSLHTNNIWASSALKSGKLDHSNLGGLYRSIYGDFTGVRPALLLSTAASGGFTNSSGVAKLGFYETSYHWFIQRFYSLNTLSSNHVVFIPTPQTDQLKAYGLSSGAFCAASSQYVQSLSAPSLLPMSVLESNSQATVAMVAPTASPVTADVYLSYSDYVLFSKSRVDAMQNLSKNTNSSDSFFFTPIRLK